MTTRLPNVRDAFTIPDDVADLNCAYMSPLSRAMVEAGHATPPQHGGRPGALPGGPPRRAALSAAYRPYQRRITCSAGLPRGVYPRSDAPPTPNQFQMNTPVSLGSAFQTRNIDR